MAVIQKFLQSIFDLLNSFFPCNSCAGRQQQALSLFASPDDTGSMPLEVKVADAIKTGIVDAMGLPESTLGILVKQAKVETGNYGAWYFPKTNNLFNRHAGSGKGEWTGQTFYVAPGDEDLRIYTDVSQSARDYVELLNDPLYKWALIALKAGDGQGFFQALEDAGFNNHNGDYAAVARQYAGGTA